MAIFTENLTFDVLGILTAFIVVTIAYLKWQLTHWDKLGVPTLNPTLPFGDIKDLLVGKTTLGGMFQQFYQEFKARGVKHGGVYFGTRPLYMPIDPDIIKHIMQIDFPHFVNRGGYVNVEADPLSGHLFLLEDAEWRNMRVKLTPTFTSGKLKLMFQTVADCTIGLNKIMEDAADTKNPIEAKDVLGRFATDIIGSVGFGLECNSLKDPDSVFRQFGRKIMDISVKKRLKAFLLFFVPLWVLKAIKFKITDTDVEEFFMKTVYDVVSYREKNNIYRKDFMHLLIQLKNRGSVSEDDKITEDGKIQEKALSMNELAAQAFVFFIAGFETSSTTMTFTLLELAKNPDIQDKLREEINASLAKHDGKITYHGIMEMTYMDKVLQEVLRKYPPIAILNRECTKDYTLPQTNITLKKGTLVFISVAGLQSDSEYYPNPEIFDPERFSEEKKKIRPAFTWLPFGEGPRICIGMRFGLLQSKVGLTALLKNNRLSLNEKTKTPITYDKHSFGTAVEGGVWLNVEKVD